MVLWSLLVFSFFFRSHTITKKPSSFALQAWALHTSSFPPLERQSPAQLETKSIKAPLLMVEWGGFLLPGGTHRPLAHPNRFWTGMPSQTWCMSQSLVSMLPFSCDTVSHSLFSLSAPSTSTASISSSSTSDQSSLSTSPAAYICSRQQRIARTADFRY